MHRTTMVTAVLLACAASVSACRSDPVEGPLIRGYPSDGDLPTAQVSGTLELREDCLVIGSGVTVWTDDATWDADARAVELDGTSHAVGDEVSLGGGFYEDGGWEDVLADDAVQPTRDCLDRTHLTTVVLVG